MTDAGSPSAWPMVNAKDRRMDASCDRIGHEGPVRIYTAILATLLALAGPIREVTKGTTSFVASVTWL